MGFDYDYHKAMFQLDPLLEKLSSKQYERKSVVIYCRQKFVEAFTLSTLQAIRADFGKDVLGIFCIFFGSSGSLIYLA